MNFWEAITRLLLNLPPWSVVLPDEMAVRITLGKYKKTLGAGFYWKWPIFEQIEKLCVREQLVNLPNQSVCTKDKKTLAISGVIKYEIEDVRKALLNVFDFDRSLQNQAMAAIAAFVANVNYNDCTHSNICSDVLDELRSEAEGWGIDILDFYLTDLTEATVYRIMSQDTVTPIPV